MEHPATKLAETSMIPRRLRSRIEYRAPDDLRRENARSVPKGRRSAAVIPAVCAPCMGSGRTCTKLIWVLMMTVLVELAVELTVNIPGEKVQVADCGRLLQVRATEPLKLLVGAMLIVNWAEDPPGTLTVGVDELMP